MAREILILETAPGEAGVTVYRVLVFYPISPPITTSIGTTIVLTPSESLPREVEALGLLTVPEKTALDSGAVLFEERLIRKPDHVSKSQLLAALRAQYSKRKQRIITRYRDQYAATGTWVDV